MQCRIHPDVLAVDRCSACMESFCANCLVTIRGSKYCSACKKSAVPEGVPVVEVATRPCPEAGEALKYAIIGIVCFGIVLEPMAISKALRAKKLIAADPTLTGSGKANAAMVIGIAGLLLWVLGMISRFDTVNNR